MKPSRGEIWLVDLNPVKGHEQAGKRPALILSVNQFNQGPAELVIVLPITTKSRSIPLHVEISPVESSLDKISFIKCEDVRSVTTQRLALRLGTVPKRVMNLVEDRMRILLGL
jgi:mRNA interferase MazF